MNDSKYDFSIEDRKDLSYYLATYDDDILHKVASEIVLKTKDDREVLRYIAKRMTSIMIGLKGVGLSAPQVGVSLRVIVAYDNGELIVIANPIIEKRYGGTDKKLEGCLSYAGCSKKILRHKRILVTGVNQYGEKIRLKLKGQAARIVQHEVDHLNGITIF